MHTGNGSGDADNGRNEHDEDAAASNKKGKKKRIFGDEHDEEDDDNEEEFPNKKIKGGAKTKLPKHEEEEDWDAEIANQKDKINPKQP